MFIEEITNSTKYPDVYIVPVEAGLRYMQAPMDKETIAALGKKDTSPFGCEAIEAQSGKYAANPCGSGQLCGPYDVVLPEDNINHEQRWVAVARIFGEGAYYLLLLVECACYYKWAFKHSIVLCPCLPAAVCRYMTICKYITENGSNGRQECPDYDTYPWLNDNCGGVDPCNDCVP